MLYAITEAKGDIVGAPVDGYEVCVLILRLQWHGCPRYFPIDREGIFPHNETRENRFQQKNVQEHSKQSVTLVSRNGSIKTKKHKTFCQNRKGVPTHTLTSMILTRTKKHSPRLPPQKNGIKE